MSRKVDLRRRTYRWTFAIVAMVLGAVISGSFLRADVPQVATGSWMDSGPFGDALSGAASAILPDGKVIVAGGQLADGSLTGAVVLYDPALGEWKSAGALIEPRTGLSAASLADGRVVFAGGRTNAGVAASIEVFDPQAGSSQPAGEMMLRRADAAAATLPDGRVLIAGGTDGAGPLAAAELFDPVTGTSQFAASLAVARTGLSATTLLDGHVLVAGGNDGHSDLAMAEIYDPELGIFWETESMNTARSRHVAMRLPGSNTVLVAGGVSNGVALKSAEQYAHWGQLWLAYEPLMSAARVGAIAAPTSRPGVVLIGGGGDPSGEYYGYATVGTDKGDYAPYETVTISGSGWQPGETVHLRVSEDSDSHYDWELETVADEFGNIVNGEFYPRNDEVYHHIGMRFYLSAVGVGSQAQATFTDADATTTTLSITGPNPLTVGQQVTFTAEVSSKTGGPVNEVGDKVAFYDQAKIAVSKRDCKTNNLGDPLGQPQDVDASGKSSMVYAFTSAGSYVVQACYTGSQGRTQDSASSTITENVNSAGQTAITVTVDAKSKTYGDGDPLLTYTVNPALQPGDSFTGALTRDAGENVGAYAITQGTLSAGSNYTITFVPANLTVTAKPLTVTVDAKSKTYSDGDPALTYTVNPALKVGDSFTGALTRDAGENVGAYAIKQGTLTASSNYALTFVGATLTINARPVTVTADAQTKVYGEADPTLTYTGLLHGTDTFTGTLARAAGENVGTYAINQGSLSAGGNYALTFVGANLTITARPITVTADVKSKTYGDTDPALTAQVAAGHLVGTDTLTGALSRDAGENVGTFAINQGSLSAGNNYTLTFVGANLTITARPITVTADPRTKVYGDADPALTAQVTVGHLVGTDTLTGALTRDGGENVGTYAINPGSLSAGSNYTLTFVGADLTITARPVAVTADAQTKVYGDADPTLTYTGVLHGTDTFTGTLTRAAGENVGTYAINLGSLSAGSNYTLTFVGANLTVTTRAVTVTADAKSKVYGDTDPALTAQVTAGHLVGADTLTGALTRDAGENVGTYAINQGSLSAGDNYALAFVGANLTISARPVTVTADAQTKVYGDTDPTLTYKGVLQGTDSFTGMLARAVGENVGAYAISQGSLSAGGNYTLTFVGANLTISARPVTVTADAQTKVYGDADPTLTYTGVLHGTDSFTGTLARTAGENVGTYAINLGSLSAGSNYTLTFVGTNLTVTTRAVTVTADAKSKVYGDTDPALTAQVTAGHLVGADTLTGALTRAAGESVGSYTIGQGTLALSANYALTFVGADLTINARPLTVKADPKSKTYGDADPALTYQITGGSLVNGDGFDGGLERMAGESVGNYAITQGTLVLSNNYALTFNGANLAITARNITVTADAKTKTYGEADPALTYQITGGNLVNGDAFGGALERLAGESVGSHPITQGSLALSDNYDMHFAGANLTITARPVTVTADAKSKTYGDADPTLTHQITAGNLVSGDNFTGNLARMTGEDVGSYAIQQGTLSAGSNYTLTFISTNLTISKRGVTVTADAKSKTYGDGEPALTHQITSGSLVSGDSFSGNLERVSGENVGTYAINQGTLSVSSNYTLTFVGASLTINPRPVTVTAEAKSKTYGDADPALTYKVTAGSLVGADSFSGALTRVAGESVAGGPYAITQNTLALSSNYALTFVGANLTITPATLTVKANDAARPYGVANPNFTGTYSGQKNGETFTMSFTTTTPIPEAVGTWAIVPSASGATMDNYTVTKITGTLTIGAWSLKGFYEPVGETSSIFTAAGPTAIQPAVSNATVWNSIKGGQTVPLKFNIYRAVGGAQVTTVADAFNAGAFSVYQLSCSGGSTEDAITGDLSAGSTELRWDGTQFIQNWKTPKGGSDMCYRAVVMAKDGSTITAFFKVKK